MRCVGICGTPGTGKKTVAPLVADLMGLQAVPLNFFAKGKEEVDTARLRRTMLKEAPPNALLFGHLLPHVLRRSEASYVAVLRCEPSVLRERLEQRGYHAEKVVDNVEAELIGVVLDECVATFGAAIVHEYDTTSASPKQVARAVSRGARSSEPRKVAPAAWIDWTLDYGSSSKLRSLLAGREPPAST